MSCQKRVIQHNGEVETSLTCPKEKDQEDDNNIASTRFVVEGHVLLATLKTPFNAAMSMAPPRHVEVIYFDATQKNVMSKKSVGSTTIISEYITNILEKTRTLLGE